jgi:hypothetical protein
VLQLAALVTVWLSAASAGATVPLPIRMGPTELHYAWLHAGGDVAGYYVRVSRSGGPFALEQTVSRPEAWIPVGVGEVVRMQVIPFNAYWTEGPSYPIPPAVLVFDPADDADGDGLPNGSDPCPIHPHANQDGDGDGIPDACDICPLSWNPRAFDIDRDGIGDACDADIDGDGLGNHEDLCPRLPTPESSDRDGDGIGDACDPCSTLAWTDPPLNPPDQNTKDSGIIFKNLWTPDAQGLRLEGKFSPWSFNSPIDPSVTGLSFRVEDADGPIYSLGIPPGATASSACDTSDGWKLSFFSGNPIWKYINKSGSLDPIGCAPGAATLVSVIVRDKRLTKGWVEYVIEFKDLNLDHLPVLPAHSVAAVVTLGDDNSFLEPSPVAASGSCGETFLASPADSGFRKPFCKPSFYLGELNKIVCRGL